MELRGQQKKPIAMSKIRWRSCCFRVLVFLASQSVLADDVHVVWRSDFDGGDLNGSETPFFMSGKTKQPEHDRLIFHSRQGVVTLGRQFGESGDYAELAWTKLKGLSLQKNPILEMRYRFPTSDPSVHIEVQPTFLTADGSRKTTELYIHPDSGQWRTTMLRLAGDEPLPREWRPQELVGLSIRVHSQRPAEVKIDWVRLRERNAAEQRREEEWLSLVSGGPPSEPAVLREFFPFGVYDDQPDVAQHPITHRHSFDLMSRNHLNYKQAGHIHVQRHPDGSLTAGPALKAAEQTGVRMSARVRPVLERFGREGVDAARAWVKPSVDAIGENQVVIGYDIGDERPLTDLWAAAGSIRILEQLDPTRFTSHCFFKEPDIQAYKPHLCLYLCDIYPLGRGRSAEYLYDWCYSLAKQTDNRRHWVILQTFGDTRTRRSGAHGGWILPSLAELRLMTFGSIAGGARGVIYYGFNSDHAELPLDQWTNPQNELLAEISRLGERLIPIGRRLLDTEVDFETVVKNDNEEHVIAGILHSSKRNVDYLVIVNKNLKTSESTTVELPAAWRGRKVLDLTTLAESSDSFQVSLSPGDGQIYMIGSAEQSRTESHAIRSNRIEESLRVMKPDLSTAKGWKLDISKVLHLQEAAEKVVEQGGPFDVGEDHARKAGELLEALLAASEPYAVIRSQLDRIGRRMGEVEPVMFEDHLDATTAKLMTPFRDLYWQLHARWAEAYDMVLEGRRGGLQLLVETLASDYETLLPRVREALGD